MLAEEFDCDAATIGNRIKAAGYELRPSNNIQCVIVDATEARRLHDKEALSQDEIARRLGCSRPVAGKALRNARVKPRRGNHSWWSLGPGKRYSRQAVMIDLEVRARPLP
jgi:hypothetical protein